MFKFISVAILTLTATAALARPYPAPGYSYTQYKSGPAGTEVVVQPVYDDPRFGRTALTQESDLDQVCRNFGYSRWEEIEVENAVYVKVDRFSENTFGTLYSITCY